MCSRRTSLASYALIDLIETAQALMRDARLRWWLVGGVALSLHAGRSWRSHDDLDLAALHSDASALDGHLDRLVRAGSLLVADGVGPDVDGGRRYVSALRERRLPVEFLLSEGDTAGWIYRRDATLRVPWSQAVLCSDGDVPYLAPELVLLSKSRSNRARDELDAREAIPDLEVHRRSLLASRIAADHPWQSLLSG
jgi:hypothetical protein